MPAHLLDPNDPKNIARILLCIVMEHGGELRLKAATYESYERSRFLSVDYDVASAELVLRSTSNFGRAIPVQPESAAWSRPIEEVERPTQQAQLRQRQRTARSDEELAAFEEARTREAQLAAEAASGGAATRFRNVPPGVSPNIEPGH